MVLRPSWLAGLDELDAFDAGDAIFDHLGDAGLDDGGCRPPIHGLDAHHGWVDIWVFAQRQAIECDQAEGDQQHGDHGSEHRSPYGQIGDDHRGLAPCCGAISSARGCEPSSIP